MHAENKITTLSEVKIAIKFSSCSKNYITPPCLDIFTPKLYGSFFNKCPKQPKKIVYIFINLVRRNY